ncbi:hypothetical protein HY792_05320 [Candidatus Desantisbacteria bacterium]|nr:hypothetical protein [Candidatus Desantisbacteria bacterium]
MDRYKRTEDIVILAYAEISLMQHYALDTDVVQPQRLSFLRMQESLISPRPGGIINPVIPAYAGISLMPVETKRKGQDT